MLVLLAISLLFGVGVLAANTYIVAVLHGRYARRAIDSEDVVAYRARRTADISRKIFSPRLFVVRVANPVWPTAVEWLGSVAEVVIIDVSLPSEALLWEIEATRHLAGDSWRLWTDGRPRDLDRIIVGAQEYVAPLADPRITTGNDRRAQLARALDGEEIIAYGPTPTDHERFVLALRNRLNRASGS